MPLPRSFKGEALGGEFDRWSCAFKAAGNVGRFIFRALVGEAALTGLGLASLGLAALTGLGLVGLTGLGLAGLTGLGLVTR